MTKPPRYAFRSLLAALCFVALVSGCAGPYGGTTSGTSDNAGAGDRQSGY